MLMGQCHRWVALGDCTLYSIMPGEIKCMASQTGTAACQLSVSSQFQAIMHKTPLKLWRQQLTMSTERWLSTSPLPAISQSDHAGGTYR